MPRTYSASKRERERRGRGEGEREERERRRASRARVRAQRRSNSFAVALAFVPLPSSVVPAVANISHFLFTAAVEKAPVPARIGSAAERSREPGSLLPLPGEVCRGARTRAALEGQGH